MALTIRVNVRAATKGKAKAKRKTTRRKTTRNPIVIAHKKDVVGRVFEIASLKPGLKGHRRTMVKIKTSAGKVYKGLIRAKDWNHRLPEMGSYAKLTRSGYLMPMKNNPRRRRNSLSEKPLDMMMFQDPDTGLWLVRVYGRGKMKTWTYTADDREDAKAFMKRMRAKKNPRRRRNSGRPEKFTAYATSAVSARAQFASSHPEYRIIDVYRERTEAASERYMEFTIVAARKNPRRRK